MLAACSLSACDEGAGDEEGSAAAGSTASSAPASSTDAGPETAAAALLAHLDSERRWASFQTCNPAQNADPWPCCRIAVALPHSLPSSLLLRLQLTSLCAVIIRVLPEINVLAAPEEANGYVADLANSTGFGSAASGGASAGGSGFDVKACRQKGEE